MRRKTLDALLAVGFAGVVLAAFLVGRFRAEKQAGEAAVLSRVIDDWEKSPLSPGGMIIGWGEPTETWELTAVRNGRARVMTPHSGLAWMSREELIRQWQPQRRR